MWIIATENLEFCIPQSESKGGHTSVDVARMGSPGCLPRLFTSAASANMALGHWLKGPYQPHCDDGGWYWTSDTDPNREFEWKGKLAAREIKMERK